MNKVWVFAYGSLIWRPDFDFIERQPVRLKGWVRRFWQGSYDHRGVPGAPGRVVTLVPHESGSCDGLAYLIDAEVAERTFQALDHREKNGYQRCEVTLEPRTDPVDTGLGATISGLVYIAVAGNFADLGEAPLAQIAQQIAISHGPSGSNREYLVKLAAALRQWHFHDDHVFDLERRVLALPATI